VLGESSGCYLNSSVEQEKEENIPGVDWKCEKVNPAGAILIIEAQYLKNARFFLKKG